MVSDERFEVIRSRLSDSLGHLREATGWLLAQKDPNDALGGATPYLELFGIVAGGFYLAKLALAAAGSDDPWVQAKIDTAVFYAANILPRSAGLYPAATSGASTLFAVDAADLEAK